MAEKLYCYTFRGSAIAAQRPMTAQKMIMHIEDSIANRYLSRAISWDDFEVYEVVPVRPMAAKITGFERK